MTTLTRTAGAGVGVSVVRPDGIPRCGENSPSPATSKPKACCGVHRAQPAPPTPASSRSTSPGTRHSRRPPCSPKTTSRVLGISVSNIPINRYSPRARCGTGASPWRLSPPTNRRPHAAAAAAVVVEYEVPSNRWSILVKQSGRLDNFAPWRSATVTPMLTAKSSSKASTRSVCVGSGPARHRSGAGDSGRDRRHRPLRLHAMAAHRSCTGRGVARMSADRVRLHNAGVGGAFGSREDISLQIHLSCWRCTQIGR